MMTFRTKAFFLAAGVSMVASPMITTAALAQNRDGYARDTYDDQDDYAQDSRDRAYDDRAYDDRGYDDRQYDDRQGDDRDGDRYTEYAEYDQVAPQGYDGTQAPPPPRGYRAGPDDDRQRALDAEYAGGVERWALDNCVKSRNNAGVGAVVGGVIGALVGNGLSNRRDRTGGTIAGGLIGAAGGAVVGGATSNETSPGCPPGYVVRGGAARFSYGAPGYAYAAPGWYRPWVFTGGAWLYRPYPYRAFYARYYRPYYNRWRGRPYGRPVYGRPRYRRW